GRRRVARGGFLTRHTYITAPWYVLCVGAVGSRGAWWNVLGHEGPKGVVLMVEEPRIADVVAPEVDTIHPEDPIRTARRRMEAQTRRSLVVVEEDRPIGVVQWRDIMSEEAVDAEAPVRDYMVREIPILTASMSLSEARERLTNVDIDRLPVVDEGGRLVGEVPRSTVTHSDEVIEDATVEATAEPTMAEPGAPPEAEQPTIGAGMTVNARAGKKLGTVDQVIVDPDG